MHIVNLPLGHYTRQAARTWAPDRAGLLKCDVEGSEAEIFADCGEWLSRVDAAVVETHPPHNAAALLADVEKAGVRVAKRLVVEKDGGVYLVWMQFE